jgi:hypothetical protein
VKPVRHHLGHQNIEYDAADTGDQSANDLGLPAGHQRDHQSAHQHQGHAPGDDPLVTEPFTDGAARECQKNARRQVKPDQKPDFGKTYAMTLHDEGGQCGYRLKLEGHGDPNAEQQGKDGPSVAHGQISPASCGGRLGSPVLTVLSAGWCNRPTASAVFAAHVRCIIDGPSGIALKRMLRWTALI